MQHSNPESKKKENDVNEEKNTVVIRRKKTKVKANTKNSDQQQLNNSANTTPRPYKPIKKRNLNKDQSSSQKTTPQNTPRLRNNRHLHIRLPSLSDTTTEVEQMKGPKLDKKLEERALLIEELMRDSLAMVDQYKELKLEHGAAVQLEQEIDDLEEACYRLFEHYFWLQWFQQNTAFHNKLTSLLNFAQIEIRRLVPQAKEMLELIITKAKEVDVNLWKGWSTGVIFPSRHPGEFLSILPGDLIGDGAISGTAKKDKAISGTVKSEIQQQEQIVPSAEQTKGPLRDEAISGTAKNEIQQQEQTSPSAEQTKGPLRTDLKEMTEKFRGRALPPAFLFKENPLDGKINPDEESEDEHSLKINEIQIDATVFKDENDKICFVNDEITVTVKTSSHLSWSLFKPNKASIFCQQIATTSAPDCIPSLSRSPKD